MSESSGSVGTIVARARELVGKLANFGWFENAFQPGFPSGKGKRKVSISYTRAFFVRALLTFNFLRHPTLSSHAQRA